MGWDALIWSGDLHPSKENEGDIAFQTLHGDGGMETDKLSYVWLTHAYCDRKWQLKHFCLPSVNLS